MDLVPGALRSCEVSGRNLPIMRKVISVCPAIKDIWIRKLIPMTPAITLGYGLI